MDTVLYVLAEVLRHIGILVQPFMPTSAEKVLDQLAIPVEERTFRFLDRENHLISGRDIPKPKGIFPRFSEDNLPEESLTV